MKKPDCIFVFFGGAMSGVFGAGVVSALQQMNFYNSIQRIYSVSAGAHNGAYFLARNTDLGSSIYSQNLTGNRFIKYSKFKFLFHFIFCQNKTKIKPLIDIDYLMGVEKHQKKLNLQKISDSKIDFFVRVFNVRLQQEEYLNGKKNTFKVLHASSAVVPFYPHLVEIENQKYGDGEILSTIFDPALEKIIAKNNHQKIFLVFNAPVQKIFSFSALVHNFIWTILLFFYFKKSFVWRKFTFFCDRKKLKKYAQKPNVHILQPDFALCPLETDPSKLLKFHSHAVEKTKKFFAEKI